MRSERSEQEIIQERLFDAPRELVWAAFTDARHLDRWWGPNGFRNETQRSDFRVGGEWRYLMHAPDGTVFPNWIRYSRIVPLERLEYGHGGEGDEPEFLVTITFEAVGAKTRVTMRTLFPSAEACRVVVEQFGALEGGQQTLARLSGFLPHLERGSALGAMVISRVFAAPPELVFRAWSTPEALARWWGPKHFTLPVCELDFRVGGAYRMVMRDPAGGEYPFFGKFLEIVPGQRIVFSATIEASQSELVTEVTFAPEGASKTLLTVRQTTPKDPMAAKGQFQGWSETLEKLAPTL